MTQGRDPAAPLSAFRSMAPGDTFTYRGGEYTFHGHSGGTSGMVVALALGGPVDSLVIEDKLGQVLVEYKGQKCLYEIQAEKFGRFDFVAVWQGED
ncbi:hypothetical protein [Amycolatopsis sp. NPDC004079]|uniref:hypothetical protein n=1 Tax=Amycolatopsis sp. NPDC004079 TaxID=3154549 RepID=UPI0033B0313D